VPAEGGGAGDVAVGARLEADGQCGRPGFAVLYRFNEGYTNAVKRPMLLQELL
jgi:hypothetical protein